MHLLDQISHKTNHTQVAVTVKNITQQKYLNILPSKHDRRGWGSHNGSWVHKGFCEPPPTKDEADRRGSRLLKRAKHHLALAFLTEHTKYWVVKMQMDYLACNVIHQQAESDWRAKSLRAIDVRHQSRHGAVTRWRRRRSECPDWTQRIREDRTSPAVRLYSPGLQLGGCNQFFFLLAVSLPLYLVEIGRKKKNVYLNRKVSIRNPFFELLPSDNEFPSLFWSCRWWIATPIVPELRLRLTSTEVHWQHVGCEVPSVCYARSVSPLIGKDDLTWWGGKNRADWCSGDRLRHRAGGDAQSSS